MLSNNEKSQSTTGVAVGTAAQVVVSIYDKIVGYSYSDADVKRLTELKHLYQETLQNMSPVFWELDNKNNPTHRLSQQKWANHVRQLTKGKHKVGRFYYQSNLIAEYAATYLEERAKRWFANGTPGDLLEQFMSEWIHFAINELPLFDFDEISIEKIYQRIKYLEKIQKHETLFSFGIVTRRRNKFDTMESIKQQLYAGAKLAAKESLRQCAREKLDICCSHTAGLLLSAAKSIYYARSTATYHEPLDLNCYSDSRHAFQTSSAKKLYPQIKKTHTGCMLYEFISLAGLESFGTVNLEEKERTAATYFDRVFSAKPIIDKSQDFDLPPWIDQKEALNYITQCQNIIERALRIAQLKKLIDSAYDLTGKIGDLWAYGDKEGKLSLEALLFLLEKELESYDQCFDNWYHHQNKLRHIYNLKYRINPNTEINLNFNKVDEQFEDFKKYLESLRRAIKDIHKKMNDFTEETVRRVNTKKKIFYRSVARYMKQYYPEQSLKYQELENCSLFDEEDKFPEEETAVLLKDTYYAFDKRPLTESHQKWRDNFIQKHRSIHLELQKLKIQFKAKVESQISLDEIYKVAFAIKEQVKILKNKAESERSQWSWTSMGWPFNQENEEYIDLVINDLNTLIKEIVAATRAEYLSQPVSNEISPVSTPQSRRQAQLPLSSGISEENGEPHGDIRKRTIKKEIELSLGVSRVASFTTKTHCISQKNEEGLQSSTKKTPVQQTLGINKFS